MSEPIPDPPVFPLRELLAAAMLVKLPRRRWRLGSRRYGQGRLAPSIRSRNAR